jgi:hypothetical protein
MGKWSTLLGLLFFLMFDCQQHLTVMCCTALHLVYTS